MLTNFFVLMLPFGKRGPLKLQMAVPSNTIMKLCAY